MNTAIFKTAWTAISTAAKTHAPAIAGGMAIAAGAVALYKAAKAAIKWHEEFEQAKADKQDAYDEAMAGIVEEKEEAKNDDGSIDPEKLDKIEAKRKALKADLTFKEKAKIFAKHYWRPAVWALISGCCVVASVYIGNSRLKAATTLAIAAEAALNERISAEVAQIGEKKTEAITNAIHGKRAENAINQVTCEDDIVDTGKGKVLYVETTFTGRPFYSCQGAIDAAINDLNQRLNLGDEVTLNDYLEALGIPGVEKGDDAFFVCDPSSPYKSQHDLLSIRYVAKEITKKSGELASVLAVRLDNEPMYHSYMYR